VTEFRKQLEHHQALFREVNDRIRDNANLDVAIFMCECGHEDCMSTVALSLEQYKRIRSNATWFVLRPEHVIPEIARVISEGNGFMVVERLAVFDHEQETLKQGAERAVSLG
jgi:hypothetical protein